MGPRSQIFIRYNFPEKNTCGIIAQYFQWNYGERMISRARGTMEWIKERINSIAYYHKNIKKIVDINFDYRDVMESTDLIAEYKEYGEQKAQCSLFDWIFHADNNDGKLIIDVDKNGIRYAFIDDENNRIGDGREYLEWDRVILDEQEYEVVKFTKSNLHWLEDNVELMTDEQVKDYIETFIAVEGE